MDSEETRRPRSRHRTKGGLAPHEALPHKSKQIQQLVELKERALNLTEGFAKEAAAFKRGARKAWREGDTLAALSLAHKFAERWNIPYDGKGDVLPLYLADTPYSANPAIDAQLRPIARSGDMLLPMVEVAVDLRFGAKEIERALRRILSGARQDWARQGGRSFQARTQDVKRWKRWLDTIEATDRSGLDVREYITSGKAGVQDESRVYALRKRAREFLKAKGHESILPALNADELSRINAAWMPYPFSAFRQPPLEAEIVSKTPIPKPDGSKPPRPKQ